MKDIAEMLGIAESTVSRALNGKPGVSQELRNEIIELAEKINYRPNALAQGLARGKTRTLGVIIPDIESIFFTRIFKGVEEAANNSGFRIILGNTENSTEKVSHYLSLFNSHRVEGNIVIGEGLADTETLQLALEAKPVVLINCYMEEMLIPSVLVEHQSGAYDAVNNFIENGYQDICLLNGPENEFFSQEIYRGYVKALEDNKLSINEGLVKNISLNREGGYNALCDLMESGDLPSALFAADELAAVGAIEALKIGGFFIPEDIPVAAYGESIISSVVSPRLTTVRRPAAELGRRAFRIMLKLIRRYQEERENDSFKNGDKKRFQSRAAARVLEEMGEDMIEILNGEIVFRESYPG